MREHGALQRAVLPHRAGCKNETADANANRRERRFGGSLRQDQQKIDFFSARFVSHAAGIGLLVAACFLALRKEGVARSWLDAARQKREAATVVRTEWQALASPESWKSRRPEDSALVVLFFDYRCAYCSKVSPWLEKNGRLGLSGTVRLRHLPRPGDKRARDASRAVICADRVGRFTDAHRLMLNEDRWVDSLRLNRFVSFAGIDTLGEFARCIASDAPDTQIADDSMWAHRLRIRGTPAFVTKKYGIYFGSDTSILRRYLPDVVSKRSLHVGSTEEVGSHRLVSREN